MELRHYSKICFPQSIHGCRSLNGITHRPFNEFVVRPTCHMLYDATVTELTEGTSGSRRSVQCRFIQFPHHPQASFRSPCNTILMNTVKRSGNRVNFKPLKIYHYYGFKAALSNLLQNSEFLKVCNT